MAQLHLFEDERPAVRLPCAPDAFRFVYPANDTLPDPRKTAEFSRRVELVIAAAMARKAGEP